MLNIKEIAHLAGVSSATVSRVINDSGYVSEDTRQKVIRIIEKYNYVPNLAARSLSRKVSSYIGVVIPDIENEFFSKMTTGISTVAEGEDFSIQLLSSNESVELENKFLQGIIGHDLAGLIIAPVACDNTYTKERLMQLNENGLPIVLIDRDVDGLELSSVFVDNIYSSYEAVNALLDAGHTKIGIITGPMNSKPGRERYIGFKKAIDRRGIEIDPDYVFIGDFRLEKAYEGCLKLMNLKEPPTAIFASNNLSSLGCIKAFNELGLTIGKDVSIIGFDDIEVLSILNFNLSVVHRQPKRQGMEAMKLLLEIINTKDKRPVIKEITIPNELILRGSEKLKGD
ncbi:MAG: LacI family DNA-binding transcriptional regulator [Lagierella massiliensis]|nr:LacI family DNA-binding transcriptional regulator [Lagierella massiliensis]